MTHRSLVTAILRASRAAERAHRAAKREEERRHRQAAAEARHLQRLRILQQAYDAKRAKAEFDAASEREAVTLSAALADRADKLTNLLTIPLGAPLQLSAHPEARQKAIFASLRASFEPSLFDATVLVGPAPTPPAREDYETQISAPTGLARIFGKTRHQRALEAARLHDDAVFARAETDYSQRLAQWNDRVDRARAKHDESEAARHRGIEKHNAAVDAAAVAFEQHDLDAVIQYALIVLDRLHWPEDIPHESRIAYVPDSKHLIGEIVLPTVEVVPNVRDYTYVKSKREIRERPRPRPEIQSLYRTVIAGMALRIFRELFGAVSSATADTITLNGVLDTIDPATGEHIRPCILSVRVTREAFDRLHLDKLEPAPCLAALGATVSKRPDELAPVRPVIEFDMVDRRFVHGDDVLEELDDRANIMDLNPFQFEELVTNLFSKMGLEAKLTRSSRDGGVDCVAFDQRPILGGKVVVQAKRYKHTVGVSAVRDLFGTMMNEGANKGILVTTAGFGPDAFEFAKDKPIELIDGSGLLFLLAEHGVQARIIMPD